jgi:hypothetical protein
MNTPAHVVINLVILGRKDVDETPAPIALGAILPDLPMMIFYLYEKAFRQLPEDVIWSQRYDDATWQGFFGLFNSFPLTILGLVLAYRFGASRLAALFSSMALHVLGDAFLHHDDAHSHLFPLSDWRFRSPVSYWDPQHYGQIIAPVEAIAVVSGCVLLARRFPSARVRILLGCLVTIYAASWVYALLVWA